MIGARTFDGLAEKFPASRSRCNELLEVSTAIGGLPGLRSCATLRDRASIVRRKICPKA